MTIIQHHQFTVQEYGRMIETGILDENDAVELIHGEIVKKMPLGRLHAATVKRLNQLLTTRLVGTAIIGVQDPIVLSDSEPEPDISLLTMRTDFYAAAKPTAADVRLVIEVSDASLEYDRRIKLPLYAQSGIAELWIVNLEEMLVECYRDPQPSGDYLVRRFHPRGESLSIAAFPTIDIRVDAIL